MDCIRRVPWLSDMSDGLHPREFSGPARPERFVPSGVDAQSWLGFEQRIQERRFRALLDGVQDAIDRGDADAASQALIEARELRPDASELRQLDERIARLPAPIVVPAAPVRYYNSRGLRAVTLLLVGMSLLIGIDWWRSADAVVREAGVLSPAVATPQTPLVSSEARAVESIGYSSATPLPAIGASTAGAAVSSAAVPPASVPQPVALAVPVASTGFASRRMAIDNAPQHNSATAPDLRVTRLNVSTPMATERSVTGEIPDDYVAPAALGLASSAPLRMASAASTPVVPTPSSLPLSAGLPVASVSRQPGAISAMTSAPVNAVAAVPVAIVPTRSDETHVAQVLNQYARAYGQLDASAARAVWPSVDERALARAFAGLSSQAVSFDSCDIDVHGVTANASCRGRASYVGRVGSREERVEPRQWRFELRRDGDAWKIETAEARRLSY